MNQDTETDACIATLSSEQHNKKHSSTGAMIVERFIEPARLPLMVAGNGLCMFMVSVTNTVVAPAMGKISTELDSLANQTWIATAYLVAANCFQPLSGKFSDIFGRKPVLLFGLSLFIIGSLIAFLTPTMSGLIAGRAVQGFGTGGIVSMLYIIIIDVAPIQWCPRFQSMLVVIWGISNVVGPLIGGAFVDQVTWRWDFWINLFIGGTSILIMGLLFKEPRENLDKLFKSKIKRIDWLGTIFSVSFVCCLLLALNWGPLYGWSSAHSTGPFVGAGASLILLVVAEGWIAREPIIPPQVILQPAVLVLYLYVIALGFCTESGIRLILYMIALIAGSLMSVFLLPKLPHIKLYLVVGAAFNLLGFGLFYTVNQYSNWGQQAGYLVFCGLAYGLSQQNAMLAVQTVCNWDYIAVATAMARSIGLAIYQTLFSVFLNAQFATLDEHTLAVANQYGALENHLYVRNLPQYVKPAIIQCYMDSLRSVFIVPIVAGGLGVIFTLLIKNAKFQAASKKDPSKNSGTGKDGDLERVSPKIKRNELLLKK